MVLEYTLTALTAWQNRLTDNCVYMWNMYHREESSMTYSWHRVPSLTVRLSVVRGVAFTPINLARTLADPNVNKLTEKLKTSAVLVTSRQPRWPHEPHSFTRLAGPTLHFTRANTSDAETLVYSSFACVKTRANLITPANTLWADLLMGPGMDCVFYANKMARLALFVGVP